MSGKHRLALLTLLLAGCSLVYKSDDHQGGDAGVQGDGGADADQDGSVCDEDGDEHLSIACGGDDCDDAEATIHPGAEDVCGDGIDQTCAGQTPLSLAVGRTSALTFFPTRLLFSYEAPRLTISGSPRFVAPLSIASSPRGRGWLVVAGVQRSSGNNVPILLGTSIDAPTTYAQIGNRISSPPLLTAIVGAAVLRQGSTGQDFELTVVRETPDGTMGNAFIFHGVVQINDNDLGLVSLASTSGQPSYYARTGAIMTGGHTPPRWVAGLSDSVGPPPSDSLISMEGTSMATLRSTASTQISEGVEEPNDMGGSMSGHVFFRKSDGDLGVWNLQPSTSQSFYASSLAFGASVVSGRPRVTEMRASGPLSAAVHEYAVALPFRDGGSVPRVAVVPFTCNASNGVAELCSAEEGTVLELGANEVFAGPVAITALADNRILVLAGVRSTMSTTGYVRMFVGTFTAEDGADILHTQDLDTYDSTTESLADVAVSFVNVSATPATVSMLWQVRGTEVVLRTAGARFCNAP